MLKLVLDHLQTSSTFEVGLFFLLLNVCIFIVSVGGCWLVARCFRHRQVLSSFQPFQLLELIAALIAVFLNAVISVVGWWLWREGSIQLTDRSGTGIVFDSLVMVAFMDIVMYFGHRLVHVPLLYPAVHRFHHRHEKTNPLSLFVLHPLEVLGFGTAMISFLLLYPISPQGLVIYLTLNLIFGTLGHCGVEPFPVWLSRIPILNLLGTSTFHAEHHEDQRYNFGFYTLFWDWLFQTLDPDYRIRYRNPSRYLIRRTHSDPDPAHHDDR
ncbi:MAG: sterol desaturase family protein [Planctomycetaceae bacterium]